MASNDPGLQIVEGALTFPAVPAPVVVFENLCLDISEGEIIGIFGPNGCGKSTLLNVIAGVSKLDHGVVCWRGKSTELPKPGFVFQAYAQSLLPWLNCVDNISLPLMKRLPARSVRREFALKFCHDLDLVLPWNNRPDQLSGGQKQMACIARALISEPDVLLLDEPLAALDYLNRLSFLTALQELWMRHPITTALVSHDVDEALFLCDRIFVLSHRPATVLDIVEVGTARPRTLDFLSSAECGQLRQSVLKHFREGTHV